MSTDVHPALRVVPDLSPLRAVADPVAAPPERPDELGQAMASRVTIEQAKGMVMLCYGVCQDQALAVLLRWSSLWDVTLRDLAAAVVRVGVREPLDGAGPVLRHELARALGAPSRPARVVDSVPPRGA